ncbi:hypothetical protein TNCV_4378351 [Trichonephila clavipes]|nr:hypothetical protein TNCV_4378351 [Trichonephila clavipes]
MKQKLLDIRAEKERSSEGERKKNARAPDHRPARLESARSILIFTIILRYRSVESDLRVSLVNNELVGPYSATVLVTLPPAPDHRPPRLESAR